MKGAELKLCGMAAVSARFKRDPGSIQRLYFDYATGRKIGIMCRTLAAAKKIYRCVEATELEKVGGTMHHGGIVAVVEAKHLKIVGPREIAIWFKNREPVLFLDRIGNAHNLGAIARTAGFFGLPRIIIADDPQSAKPNDAAYRVSEGALEAIEVWSVPNAAAFLRDLSKAGYNVLGAAARGGSPSDLHKGPTALVMGNEEHGLSPDVAKACSRLITIPGSGKVESLNVSAAAAVLIWDLFKR